MKQIIDIYDELFSVFKKHGIMAFDYLNEYDKDNLARIIANGIPYNPTGDCISREALKEHKIYSEERHEYVVPVYNIDKAPTVEHSLLPLASDLDSAYMRGYEFGKAEGIMKASTRPKGGAE